MGVQGLWQKLLPSRSLTSVQALSTQALNNNCCGFRIGIDASIWLYQIERGLKCGGETMRLQTFFFRCARLLRDGFLPIFVFDGPHRPRQKRGKHVRCTSHNLFEACKAILHAFGFSHCIAPGEAEAELAYLNRTGVIDAVLSDDVDSFVFGARMVIRNASWAEGKQHGFWRDGDKVITYNLPHPDLSDLKIGELILLALCSGCDYVPGGLPGCGIEMALGLAKAGFGEKLYNGILALGEDSSKWNRFLLQWKTDISRELETNSSNQLPSKRPSLAQRVRSGSVVFPCKKAVHALIFPLISGTPSASFTWGSAEPSLPDIFRVCRQSLNWLDSEVTEKRFRTILFPGVLWRFLRRVRLTKQKYFTDIVERSRSALADYSHNDDSAFLRIYSSRVNNRNGLVEYRLGVSVILLVRFANSGLEENCEVAGLHGTTTDPIDDCIRIWCPAILLDETFPGVVSEFKKRSRRTVGPSHAKGVRARLDAGLDHLVLNRTRCLEVIDLTDC